MKKIVVEMLGSLTPWWLSTHASSTALANLSVKYRQNYLHMTYVGVQQENLAILIIHQVTVICTFRIS